MVRNLPNAKKNILALFPAGEDARRALRDAVGDRGEVTFWEDGWSREEYENALSRAHIIIGEPRNEDLSFCTWLELMQSSSSGVNYYVQGGCFPKNAILCSMTGGYGRVLAEHLLGMTLALCRRLPEYRDQQTQRLWQLRKYDKQLDGATLLILGAGDIGTTLAQWMRPMVGTVLGIRRTARKAPECYDEMGTLEDLDWFLPRADLVLCALPHTPETAGLLDERRLRLMKKDAVLVNGGRGSLIDQAALCRVLEEGHLWGVGLEVTSPEPLPPDSPLWDQPRVLITPHAAGNSFAPGSPLDRTLWRGMTENVAAYLAGEPLRSRVDFATGYRRIEERTEL